MEKFNEVVEKIDSALNEGIKPTGPIGIKTWELYMELTEFAPSFVEAAKKIDKKLASDAEKEFKKVDDILEKLFYIAKKVDGE